MHTGYATENLFVGNITLQLLHLYWYSLNPMCMVMTSYVIRMRIANKGLCS